MNQRGAIHSSAWLAAGTAALAFGQGHWANPIGAIVGVACIVRFFRITPGIVAFLAFALAHVAVMEWAFRGMMPLPTAGRLGVESGVSCALALVFTADAWVRRRAGGFWTTLVLPCAWVVFDHVSALASLAGSWGSIAYSLAEPLVVAQVASLFGWTSLTFLVGWTAATLDWVAVRGWRTPRGVRGLGIVLSVWLALLGWGSWRLSRPAHGEELTVACIVAPSTYAPDFVEDVWGYTRGVEMAVERTERARERIRESLREHFRLVEQAADEGAQLVVWAEANASVTSAEEQEWIECARGVARNYGIFVGMGLSVFRPATGEPTENKLVLIDPEGETSIEYWKATRVPGSHHAVGDGVLPVVETELGVLSSAICFDLDFPQLPAQAGAARVDVFLAPSNDWEEAGPTHAAMARMRAIEQGFTLVRPTKDGISLVTDARGRVAGRDESYQPTGRILTCSVRAQNMTTLYSRVGNVLPWAAWAGLVAALAASFGHRTPPVKADPA